MSNIEHLEDFRMPPGPPGMVPGCDGEPGWESAGWNWNGREWVWCGFRPPPRPCPSPLPPPPVLRPPSCFSAIAKANACWDQTKLLTDFMTKVVTELLTTDPAIIEQVLTDNPQIIETIIKNNPGILQQAGPIVGVTDGSDAAPGQVGEFIETDLAVDISGSWNQSQSLNGGVLPAGDWDVQASFTSQTLVGGISFFLSPQPTGVSNDLSAGLAAYVSTAEAAMTPATVTSPMARASLATPTLFAFTLQTNYLGGGGVIVPQPGGGTFVFTARRMR